MRQEATKEEATSSETARRGPRADAGAPRGADVPEEAQALAARIPGAHLVVLPGVGHLPWVERPDAANGAIPSFLTEAGAPVPAG